MKIKIINGKLKLYTKGYGKIEKLRDLYDSYVWRMRCIRHSLWIKFTKFLIKYLAMSLLKRSNIYIYHMKRYKTKPYIKKFEKPYKTTCYKSLAGEYNTDIKYYIMKMDVAEYTFWGNSEYEIYLNIIKSIAIKVSQYPFCIKGGLIGLINNYKPYND